MGKSTAALLDSRIGSGRMYYFSSITRRVEQDSCFLQYNDIYIFLWFSCDSNNQQDLVSLCLLSSPASACYFLFSYQRTDHQEFLLADVISRSHTMTVCIYSGKVPESNPANSKERLPRTELFLLYLLPLA